MGKQRRRRRNPDKRTRALERRWDAGDTGAGEALVRMAERGEIEVGSGAFRKLVAHLAAGGGDHVARHRAGQSMRRLLLQAGELDVALEVALAFATADPLAGSRSGQEMTTEERARAMVVNGYVAAGDPARWGDGDESIYATIFTEQQGYDGDCMPPANSWGGREAILAPGLYWEWVNSAVGHVYQEDTDPDPQPNPPGPPLSEAVRRVHASFVLANAQINDLISVGGRLDFPEQLLDAQKQQIGAMAALLAYAKIANDPAAGDAGGALHAMRVDFALTMARFQTELAAWNRSAASPGAAGASGHPSIWGWEMQNPPGRHR